MSKHLQSIRGMHDILPTDTPLWQYLEQHIVSLFSEYGYQEIRIPIVERTELFQRGVGEVTDIVEKEMYTFDDRNGESLSLRPELTAGCVRACIQHGLLHNQQPRLWYSGPMFRYEKPQEGRYRQFHQFGAESFGMPGPDIDAELIAMSARLWERLGLKNIKLELNSLGTPESRRAYRQVLIDYFSEHQDILDEEARNRLHSNPLRILDTKNPQMRAMVEQAPSLHEHLDQASHKHFEKVCNLLENTGIRYHINPRLVRGMDYYTRTVFEWVTDELGTQGTVCAGGRYDGLVEQLGGRSTPGCGFALGVERLLALLKKQGNVPETRQPDIYLVLVDEAARQQGLALAERLRARLPGLSLWMNTGEGGLKSQMKRADKSGARYALILGPDEIRQDKIACKSLRDRSAEQTLLALDNPEITLATLLGRP